MSIVYKETNQVYYYKACVTELDLLSINTYQLSFPDFSSIKKVEFIKQLAYEINEKELRNCAKEMLEKILEDVIRFDLELPEPKNYAKSEYDKILNCRLSLNTRERRPFFDYMANFKCLRRFLDETRI